MNKRQIKSIRHIMKNSDSLEEARAEIERYIDRVEFVRNDLERYADTLKAFIYETRTLRLSPTIAGRILGGEYGHINRYHEHVNIVIEFLIRSKVLKRIPHDSTQDHSGSLVTRLSDDFFNDELFESVT